MGIFLQKLSKKLAGMPCLDYGRLDVSNKPSRKIPYSGQRVIGQIASVKHSGLAVYESSLERDLIEILEFNGAVKSFVTQPEPVYYNHLGKQRYYTPDVQIDWQLNYGGGEKWLCEVKYRKDMANDWNILKPKFKAAIRQCRENGIRFKILTEYEIRTVYLDNIRFLRRYKNTDTSDYRVNLMYNNLAELRETTPEILLKSFGEGEGISTAEMTWLLWAMIAKGLVDADLLSPLSMNSAIWAKAV